MSSEKPNITHELCQKIFLNLHENDLRYFNNSSGPDLQCLQKKKTFLPEQQRPEGSFDYFDERQY
jgi:hypothetical protein